MPPRALSPLTLPRRVARRGLTLLAAAGLTLAGGACRHGALINFNSGGTRYDRSSGPSRRPPSKVTRKMVIAITTDPSGDVTDVQFVRSSGSSAVDDFVRESIKSSWPGQNAPNTETTVELTYSQAAGFSEPRTLSVKPNGESAAAPPLAPAPAGAPAPLSPR